jgi:chromosome partitioning protein
VGLIRAYNPSPAIQNNIVYVNFHIDEKANRQTGIFSAMHIGGHSPFRIDENMIITVTSYKGGVGKTTTAIHLAAYLQRLAPTLLVDGDAIRSATKWSRRSGDTGLPFRVVTHAQMVSHIRDYQHIIIDTEGNPTDDDFKDLASNCDLLVIPAVPESVATDGLTHTLAKLRSLGNKTHRVLLTMVPPKPRTEGQQLRDMLTSESIPVFEAEIPRLAAFEKAAAEGLPVYGVKDDRNAARAWLAYEAAGKEITRG